MAQRFAAEHIKSFYPRGERSRNQAEEEEEEDTGWDFWKRYPGRNCAFWMQEKVFWAEVAFWEAEPGILGKTGLFRLEPEFLEVRLSTWVPGQKNCAVAHSIK
ncbi:hypothetical protein PPACK8108_LOCUS12375 [Phakopsora pachyrhizi]|uniref:Uncharacterized protein n=1 Tax=Phakopsora pachyrhizi TaxID=170000 RepID=A0AAV0B3V9_PHAPC|nr:hypothetical protein PPACK8108_LOCUS12375 [Phakopsora pachyrhizi]